VGEAKPSKDLLLRIGLDETDAAIVDDLSDHILMETAEVVNRIASTAPPKLKQLVRNFAVKKIAVNYEDASIKLYENTISSGLAAEAVENLGEEEVEKMLYEVGKGFGGISDDVAETMIKVGVSPVLIGKVRARIEKEAK
jgi:hypothetical protein